MKIPVGWQVPPALSAPCPVPVHSNHALATEVAAKSSKKGAKAKGVIAPLAVPVPNHVTPIDALRHLALSTPPTLIGNDFTVASQWGIYRYFWAFEGPPLSLAAPARTLRFHHRTVLSEHLGIALGLAVAEQFLAQIEPGATIRFVDADHARAGGVIKTLGGPAKVEDIASNTPDYFAIATKGLTATFYAIELKGTHARPHRIQQLADAVRQLGGVAVGGSVPPGLALATVLLDNGGAIGVYALDPPSERREIDVGQALVAGRPRVSWDTEQRRLEIEDDLSFVGALLAGEADQLVRYATGQPGADERVAEPATAIDVDGERFVGRRTTIAGDGARISVFQGVQADVWNALALPERSPDRIYFATRGEFPRRVQADERRTVAIGDDGSVLELTVESD